MGQWSSLCDTLAAKMSENRVLGAVLLAAVIVHGRVLGAGFLHDDFLHLYGAAALPIGDFLTRTTGGHFMVVHKLFFLGLHGLAGVEPAPYFAVVLLTHLINVGLLFRLCRRLGAGLALSGLAAFLWGTTPVHHGTLRWFSAYGAVLSTLLTLVALLQLAGAIREQRGMHWREVAVASLALFIGAATVSGGLVVALVFPVVAALALPRVSTPRRTVILVVSSLAALTLGLGSRFVDVQASVRLFGALLAQGAGSIMLGPLAAVTDAGSALFPEVPEAFAIGVGAAAGLALLVLLLGAVRRADHAERRLILGMTLLGLALYAAVALGRTWATAKGFAWVATRDRYHYEPTALLVVGVVTALRTLRHVAPAKGWSLGVIVPMILASLGLSVVAARAVFTARDDESGAYMTAVSASIHALAQQSPPGADLYLRNDDFKPVGLLASMGMPREAFPMLGGYWVIAHGTRPLAGHRVVFVEPDDSLARIRAVARPEVAHVFASATEAAERGIPVREVPRLAAINGRWTARQRALRERMGQRGAAIERALRDKLRTDPTARALFERAVQGDPALRLEKPTAAP
jgi:hypothetical protein